MHGLPLIHDETCSIYELITSMGHIVLAVNPKMHGELPNVLSHSIKSNPSASLILPCE